MTSCFVAAADDRCVSRIVLCHRMEILHLLPTLQISLLEFWVHNSFFNHLHDIRHSFSENHVHISCKPGLLQHGNTHNLGK